ncbi:MAG TPA: CCA tRNA nucleotidyltransferase [Gemmatimonadaceae bacterium]|nr:CCA tRNA nucleotidyltransferase [Gemmatimonadaceae bacterium]
MISKLNPPPEVRKIANTLEKAGFETWCVGGAVRDAILGHPHLDWDLATAAHPGQVRNLFPRTVPIGIDFGTVGVLDAREVMHEVTTFRRDVHTDGRHAVVDFGASLDEDLARRDYTINAIAYSPSRHELRDPFNGREDLEKKIVRAVGEPGERMREDRLRALRAIRFAARFGFEIEPRTWDAIVESSAHLSRLSAERVKQEIEKTMEQVQLPGRAFSLWKKSGAFATLIPSLASISGIELATLDHLCPPSLPGGPQRRIARMIGLFAAASPPEVVLETLKGLRFSNADAAWVHGVIARWSAMEADLREKLSGPAPVDDATLRKWAAAAGRTRLASVLRLAGARWSAEREAGIPAPSAQSVASAYRRAVRIAYRDPIEVTDLAVNGRDLEKIGLVGPLVGKTLRKLLELVITDPAANSRTGLMETAQSLLDDIRSGNSAP